MDPGLIPVMSQVTHPSMPSLLSEPGVDFLASLAAAALASFHCAGMCGGFSFAASTGRSLLPSQGLYHAGKTVSYVFIGLLLVRLGQGLASSAPSAGFQKGLAILAGTLLVITGLQGLGRPRGRRLIKIRRPGREGLPSSIRGFLGAIRSYPGQARPLFLGLLSGFLPCPLVYAFAVKAAASGSDLQAIATMLALGLGTIPVLVLLAAGGRVASAGWRIRLARASGVLLVALGVFTWLRGLTPGVLPCHG